MEPRIQYATTRDGIHVAFAVSGEGPTLISVPSPPDNHVQLEWEQRERRRTIEHLSAHRRLVRFDGRGTGLSDRAVSDFSLEARLLNVFDNQTRLTTDAQQYLDLQTVATPPYFAPYTVANPFFGTGSGFAPPRRLHLAAAFTF